jgi:carbon-monoxide dehydrogenase small subunit
MAKLHIELTVNGDAYEVLVEPDRTLLDVLRDDLGLTGTKTNCLEAECGVCTVLLDGLAVDSCLVLAATARGRRVTTIEGLARDGELHPIQEAFIEHGAVQCGYCIPGMIMSAAAFLEARPAPSAPARPAPSAPARPAPSADAIREALAGNLCRCTGYQKIVEAVAAAACALEQAVEPARDGRRRD